VKLIMQKSSTSASRIFLNENSSTVSHAFVTFKDSSFRPFVQSFSIFFFQISKI